VALIYTRLGRLFYNESYCDIAILQYNKALNYINILEDNFSKANILKSLGNTYQLSNKLDDALHYYNESLIFNNNINNKLDIDKCIAQILFSKGEKDSAYILLKKNLNYINNNNVIYSYHCLLGSMYYNDKNYDSALYYLEETIDDSIILKKHKPACVFCGAEENCIEFENQKICKSCIEKMQLIKEENSL
jgi:tetratricopeptide (TPR) repeat protein